jgi:hypothetical protein
MQPNRKQVPEWQRGIVIYFRAHLWINWEYNSTSVQDEGIRTRPAATYHAQGSPMEHD